MAEISGDVSYIPAKAEVNSAEPSMQEHRPKMVSATIPIMATMGRARCAFLGMKVS